MVNIDSLMNVLPISGLEPQWIASISGLAEPPDDQPWKNSIHLFEPPAGARVPYIEPIEAIETLLRGQGVTVQIARSSAREAVASMKKSGSGLEWVIFFDDFEPESPDCMPVPAFVEWFRNQWPQLCRLALASLRNSSADSGPPGLDRFGCPELVDFFERAVDVIANTPMLRGPDNWWSPYSLIDKPFVPPPKAMIEFMPGAPWSETDGVGENEIVDYSRADFLRWREDTRPIAKMLEESLGEPVFHFAELDDDLGDDVVHRFLVLHWCCTWKPESRFIKYLIRVSGARDVDELKAALIDPANYHHPFQINDAFDSLEAIACRFEYLVDERKTVGFVFSTPEAQQSAYILLRQQIGIDVLLVAPPELLETAWVEEATADCRSWSAVCMTNHTIEAPISILSQVDRLRVIGGRQEHTPAGCGLQLTECVEDLLWLAIKHGVDVRYYAADRLWLSNPDTSLEQHGVPERVTARLAKRSEFTQRLKAIRVGCDYSSSGLWDESGRMLRYDDLDLPFALIRRVAAWQKDFDLTLNPPEWMGDDAWRQRHEQEQLNIVRELRAALKGRVKVIP